MKKGMPAVGKAAMGGKGKPNEPFASKKHEKAEGKKVERKEKKFGKEY